MKKLMTILLLGILVIIGLSTAAYAETVHYMCEPITEDTTWEGTGHTYYICRKETKNGWSSASEFSVEPDVTLTIKSGARVYMNYNANYIEPAGEHRYTWMYEMNVYGHIVADGVTFTDSEKQYNNVDKDCSWKSINIYSGRGGDNKTESTGPREFTDCTFSGGGVRNSVYYDSMIALKNGNYDDSVRQTVSLTLENCTLSGFDMGNGRYGSGVESFFFPNEEEHSYLTFSAKNCIFGSAEAPLSRAFAVHSTYYIKYSASFDGCSLYSRVAAPDTRGFVHAYRADKFCMKNCTIDLASPANFIIASMASYSPMERSNNEISLVMDGEYLDGYPSLSGVFSGQPLKKLELKNGATLNIYYTEVPVYGTYYRCGFTLAIADDGEFLVSDGCSFKASYSNETYFPNPILKLGKNATLSGLTVYQSDGTTASPSTSANERRFFLNTKSKWILENSSSARHRSISIQTKAYDTVNTQRLLFATFKDGKLASFTILEKPSGGWSNYSATFSPSDIDEPDCFCAFFLNENFLPTGQALTFY